MKVTIGRLYLGKTIMAIFLVLLLFAGAFMSAAQDIAIDQSGQIEALLPSMDEALETGKTGSNFDNAPVLGHDGQTEYLAPIIPALGPIDNPDIDEESNLVEIIESDKTLPENLLDSSLDPNIPISNDKNSFSEALGEITEHLEDSSEPSFAPMSTLSIPSSITLTLGADNTQYPGQSIGRLYNSGTTYTAYNYPYFYPYDRPSTQTGSRYRAWATFDLSDLTQYYGVSITSGKIIFRQDYKYSANQIDYYSMNSIPYGGAATSTVQGWYNEIGGSGSVLMGNAALSTSSSESTNKDISATIPNSGINELNKRLNNSNYDFAFGTIISQFYSGATYGYCRGYDLRMELTFTVTGMPDSAKGEIAVGDALSGYCSTGTMYDIGSLTTSTTSYRAFASWDTTQFKDLIPDKGPGGEPVTITGISLRVDYPYTSTYYLTTLSINHMNNDPRSYISSPSTVYTDCGDGTNYVPSMDAYSFNTPEQFEWELGADALDDFNLTLKGTSKFFALGLARTSSSAYYLQTPKLVIKWNIDYPPMHSLRLGADNPEKAGHAVGYSGLSGSTYSTTSSYYARLYTYGTSTEYRAWMVFDLKDLKKWDGVNIKTAKLIVQNYNRNNIKAINFTLLKTTPYDSAPSTTAKSIFVESGPSGTIIGDGKFSTTSSSGYAKEEFTLNSVATTSINNILNSTSKYKTFAIGSNIVTLHSGTTGLLWWYDVRLEVKFTYESELKSSKSGNGIAFGDELSGYMYKSTSAIDYPHGYIYVKKDTSSEYRGYAQWDISDIHQAFEEVNISRITIKKVSLRMNHWKNTLTKIEVHQVKENITKKVTTDPDAVFTDLGDGTKYYSGGPTGSSFTEYEWDLGSKAVDDFQAAFEDKDPDYFGLGIITTASSTSDNMRDHEPKLVIEFKMPDPEVIVNLDIPDGFEGTPTFFNANASRNLSGGFNGLRFEWDWDNDGKFDEKSTSPYTNHTWFDDYIGNITLRVNDSISNQNTSKEFTVHIQNMDPKCNSTNGVISPQPAYEANNVTFSGFTVDDPAGSNDEYWYFWDFNNDGLYDVNGKCNGSKIPSESWYYDDDHLGEVSLLIVDEDGGTTNLSTYHQLSALPNSGNTGYVYYYGTSYSSSSIYYRYEYTYDYQRGWAKIDLSELPDDAIINKLIFKGTVAYNDSVNMLGVHLLTSDPTSATGSIVFSEIESGTRLFGLTASTGAKEHDLTNWVKSPSGEIFFANATQNGWLALGFDFESPESGAPYGYLQGYGYNEPVLEINYEIQRPGCFIPVQVLNIAPEFDCNNLTYSKTSVDEGETLQISNFSFCDPGNDTYEVKFVVGDTFETDWESLGERPVSGGGGPCTLMDVGTQVTTYSGMTRGYWLKAPCDFVICGVRVPTDASTDPQSAAVLRMKDDPSTWVYSSTTNNFDQLGYWTGVSGTEKIKTSIPVKKDDWIVVLGCRGTNSMNSYGSSYYGTKIGTYDVTLTRAGFQYNLYSTAPQNIWTEPSGSIGRVELYYQLGGGGEPFTGDNLALDAVASHSGGGSGVWGPDRLNNGDKIGTYNDCWTTGGGWVQLEWKEAVTVGSMIVYYTRYRVLSSSYCLHRCEVQWWDGSNWQTDQSYDDGSYSTNNDHYIEMKQPRTTTMLRLYNMYSGSNVMIQEWEVFGGSGGGGSPGWGAYGPGCFNVDLSFNVTIPDDHPSSGTSWDDVPISVLIRDDDDHKLIPKTGVGGLLEASTITSNAYYSYALSNTRKMAIDNDYNLYVIYVNYQTSPYQIYVGKSEDNGINWDHYKVSTGSWLEYNTQYYPSLAIDSNGYLHAVWSNSGILIYANSRDGGETWGDWQNITSSGYIYSPGIAVDANDNVHISWYGYLSTTPYDIYYISRSSSGTWGKIVQVTEGSLYSYYPSLAVDSKDNVHIVWQGYTQTSTYYNIRHRLYWAGNDTWSSITDLTDGSYYNYYPSITVDSSDNAHVVWNGADPVVTGSYNIMYYKWTSSSNSWGTKEYITKITTGSPYQYNPSIAVNAKGELDVVWHGYQSPSWSSPYAIHHAQKSGSTWEIDWNVYVSSGQQYYANIFCSPQHNVAKSGYAFTWYDAYYSLKYWSSEDFEYGNPKFTDGLDICNNTIKVNNVAPKFDLKSIYTTPSEVKEQEPFILHAEFEDPAAGFETEEFEYNIQIKGGDSSGWLPVTKFKEGQPAGMTEIEYQPDAAEGKDTFTYAYSSYQDYNYGAYTYIYMGKTSTATNYKRRGFLSWDLGWIPSGYNVTKATMYLTFSYYYNSGPSATGARWFTANESWIEGDKTGSTATGGELTWNNMPGYDSSREVSMMTWPSGSSASGKTEWELNTTIVQEWIDNPNSNFGMVSQLDNEDLTSYYGYGYFYSSDYTTASMRPQLVLEFDNPLPAIMPRGIIEAEYFISDDHPETGTPWDLLGFSVELRDDDLGSDKLESNITVNNVPPEVIPGKITPEILQDFPDRGIPEGSIVTLDGFEFDDVAYDVWSERDYGFNYSVDWGDGEVTTWNNDFRYTEEVGGSTTGGELKIIEDFEKGTGWMWSPWQTTGSTGTVSTTYAHDGKYGLTNPSWVYRTDVTLGKRGEQLSWWVQPTTGARAYLGFGATSSGCWKLAACSNTQELCFMNGPDWSYTIIASTPYTFTYNKWYLVEVAFNDNSGSVTGNLYDSDGKTKLATVSTTLTNFVPGGVAGRSFSNFYIDTIRGGIGGEGGGTVNKMTSCSASAYNNGRKLVMDSTNNMYTVFVDKTSPNQISISNSSDFGETWTLNAVTSGTTAQLDPSIVIDSKDVLHVVWRGMVSGYYNIRYANSADGGETWSNSKDITTGTSSPTEHLAPAIAVDSDDTVHIVWYGHDTTNTAKYNIYYTNRTSTGTWGTTTMLTSDTSDMYHMYPSIAVDSNDDVHVVWSGQTSSAAVNNIQYKMYDSSLSTWSSIKMLTTSSSNNNYNPSMAIDRDDNIHIVWHAEPSPTSIKYIKYDAVTSTWNGIEDVTSNSVNNMNPSVGVDRRGYVYVAWSKTEPNQINMSMNDGRYWTAEFELTSPSVFNSTVVYPSIIYGSKHSLAGRGVSLVFTAANMTACNLYYGVTTDFNLTDNGPWKGIPTLKHLYRDDDPSGTEQDEYTIKLMVRDDDLGIGVWEQKVVINNVIPELDKDILPLTLVGDESGLYTPEIKFIDPGTGPSETWHYWLDVDDSETMTPGDLTGKVTTTQVIDDVTHGTIPPILTPFNDDITGTIGLYLYDDDVPSAQMYINFSYPVTSEGKVTTIQPNAVSSSTYYWNSCNLVMDSKGTFYSVYYNSPTPYKVFCSVSEDLGQSWSQYQVTTDSASTSSYQYYPAIAIDSKDVLHVVWYGLASGYSYYNIRYANSVDGGKTWGNFTMVTAGTSSPNYHYAPSIAVDSKDTVHIVWYGYSYFTNSNPYNIHYINRTSSGSWSSITMLTSYTSTRYEYYPSIAVDTKDNVHVAWSGYTPWVTYYNVQYRKLDAKTGKWGPLVLITNSSSEYNYYPNIVADQNDNIHITWYGYPSPYRIKYIRYNASSSSWDSVETVYSDSYTNYYPSISVDQRGYVYICWMGGSPYMIKLLRKTSPTSSWETPVIVTDGPQFTSSQYYPSLMGHGPNCYPLQGAAMVWSGYTGSSYDVMFYSTDDFWLGETYEETRNKAKFEYSVDNVQPNCIMDEPDIIAILREPKDITFSLYDVGSDDLYYSYDFNDGSGAVTIGPFLNNPSGLDPAPSALNGTAPCKIPQTITHVFNSSGEHVLTLTAWDDDMIYTGQKMIMNFTIEVLGPKDLKERAIQLLEPLVPGRYDVIGYRNFTLKNLGSKTVTVLAYNHISQGLYGWETKLIYTFCDVKPNDEIFVDASRLDGGMFGQMVILKSYVDFNLISEVEVSTTYSCLDYLKVNMTYGDSTLKWLLTDFGEVKGVTYQHYSKIALEVENAIDNIMMSLNKDPRRGFGWWHTHWVWYCGYHIQRELWVDNSTLDPQYGRLVFCEELYATQHLMSVINNCLKCDGVHNMTIEWTGKEKVDIEVYSWGTWWKYWNKWEHTHTFEELESGDTFFIGSKGWPLCGKLATRTLIKVYKYSTGELLDAQYIRTSGFWPLEVEPGNVYGLLEIVDATLKLGCGNFWREWFGDQNIWDYYEWNASRSCNDCYDEEVAAGEEERICTNLTVIKTAINLLVKADEFLAKTAYQEAQNMSIQNQSNSDEYAFHMKMSKKYLLRGNREAGMGKPHEAIRFYRLSWENAILASKYMILNYADENGTVDPGEMETTPDFGCGCFCLNQEGHSKMWWLWWYMKYQQQLSNQFHTFPDWRDYTDPDVWEKYRDNEDDDKEDDTDFGENYKVQKHNWYIAYEDYGSDYDYNDWGMRMYQKQYTNKFTGGIRKLHIEYSADTKESSNDHFIHLSIGIQSKIEYRYWIYYYDSHGQYIGRKTSSGFVTGDFDQILFDTSEFPYKHDLKAGLTVVDIEFEFDVKPECIDDAPYDPYMYVVNSKKVIHIDTTQVASEDEAEDSNPSLEGKKIPLILIIENVSWEPPKDKVPIWTVYTKFDDWVIGGCKPEVEWWI